MTNLIGSFASWIVEGFVAPQRSVRRVLDGGHGPDVAVLLFLLAYLIEAAAAVVIVPSSADAGAVFGHILRLMFSAVMFVFTAFVVQRLGQFAGGIGTFPDALLAIGWYSVLNSLLSPIFVAFLDAVMQGVDAGGATNQPPVVSPGLIFGAVFAGLTAIWLFSNAVAALHGFRNLWAVIGVVVALLFGMAVFAIMLSGGMG